MDYLHYVSSQFGHFPLQEAFISLHKNQETFFSLAVWLGPSSNIKHRNMFRCVITIMGFMENFGHSAHKWENHIVCIVIFNKSKLHKEVLRICPSWFYYLLLLYCLVVEVFRTSKDDSKSKKSSPRQIRCSRPGKRYELSLHCIIQSLLGHVTHKIG